MNQHSPYFILGDWGTSVSRFFLCKRDRSGKNYLVVDSRTGKGVKSLQNVSAYFFDLLQDWMQDYEPKHAVISGMVGSNLGWRTIPYLNLPSSLSALAKACVCVNEQSPRILLVPGLECKNILGDWDVMRGEEIQLFGALHLDKTLSQESNILIGIPGTHSKWIQIKLAQVKNFLTGFSGELFQLIREHSVLLSDSLTDEAATDKQMQQFEKAVRVIKEGNTSLLHRLFSVRSRQIKENLPADLASYYLSGLILASDVKEAISLYAENSGRPNAVSIIASEELLPYYKIIFDIFSIEVKLVNARQASLAGLFLVYQSVLRSLKTKELVS